MAALALLLLLGPNADQYFEYGVDYLHKGFYGKARAAFSESLVRASHQAVPLALLGVAAAAEGRQASECATILRRAYERLPKSKAFGFDLRELLPSTRALGLLQRDYRRMVARRKGGARKHALTVLAFLEVFDGDPAAAPAHDELQKKSPKDPYVAALARSRKRLS